MNSIPDETLGNIRSYLTFRDAHQSRGVCKRWQSLEKTSLCLLLRFPRSIRIPLPPVFARFHRIDSLLIRLRSIHDNHLEAFALRTIVSLCQRNLKHLSIQIDSDTWYPHLSFWRELSFPKLKNVSVGMGVIQIWDVLKHSLAHVQRINFRFNSIANNSIDFKPLSAIQIIQCPGVLVRFENLNPMQSFTFLLSDLHRNVLPVFYSTCLEIENFKIAISALDMFEGNILSLEATVSRDFCYITSFGPTFSETNEIVRHLRQFVRELRRCGDMKFRINKEISQEFLGYLILTGEVSNEEIKAML